jgi:parallel beta-helix repeat protein
MIALRKKTFATVVITVAVLISIMAGVQSIKIAKAEPRTIVVPDDYPTIQMAVGNATAGDTVFVKSGTYNETITIDKSISLIGENTNTTTIRVPYVTTNGGTFPQPTAIQASSSSVRISNFTIENNNAYGVGIATGGIEALIIGNTINSQTAISDAGISTTITENTISGYTYGIRCLFRNANVTNNNFPYSSTYAIALESSSNNVIYGNKIAGYPEGYGIFIKGDSNIIVNNTITGKSDGITVWSGTNNIINSNLITQCSGIGLRIDRGVNNTFSSNTVKNCKTGAGITQFGNDNTYYGNLFLNNVQQVIIETVSPVSNFWDNGREGNYWGDYSIKYPNATEVDSSGIGNTPYVIDANNIDHYPLIRPVAIPEFPSWIILPLVLMSAMSASLLIREKRKRLHVIS